VIIIFTSLISIIYIPIIFDILKDSNDTNGVSCDKLPNVDYVNKVLNEHNDTINEVTDLGIISVGIDTERCLGRADIILYYTTISQRDKIKIILDKDFFGIPYRMFNV